MSSIGLAEARQLILSSQQLMGGPTCPSEVLERLGYVQIDTISVVERAHHHTMWSRYPKYQTTDLNQLMHSRKAFEYWAHAAAYLPMRDYRYSLLRKKANRENPSKWLSSDKKLLNAVLRRVRQEGPLRSKDFEKVKKGSNGWWDWKPAKKALESLFFQGKLEISHREGFQKVYDLPERIIPGWGDLREPTPSEVAWYLILSTLTSQGLATLREITYLRSATIRKEVREELNDRVENSELAEITVEGGAESYYVFPASLKKLKAKKRMRRTPYILSPFDNLVIQRGRLKRFFEFDYQIECYVPEKKRKFGYFCLPILRGDRFIGRIDAKAHRNEGRLEVKSWHAEAGIKKKELRDELSSSLSKFANFNGCSTLKV